MSTIQNVRESLDRNWRPVCSVGGDAGSGADFAPFPSPCLLPPTSCGDEPVSPQASSSLEFLSPFVLRMACSVFGQVNFLSCYPTV